jgi:hypothetical protein
MNKTQKELLAQLQGLKVGECTTMPSPLPGFEKEATQAFLRETQENYWLLELRWLGITYAEVTAQYLDNKLILEVL